MMDEDGWKLTRTVWQQQKRRDKIIFVVAVGDADSVVVAFRDDGLYLVREVIVRGTELQELTDFLAQMIDGHRSSLSCG